MLSALQDHDTLINVIDAVVAGTECFHKSSEEVTLGGNALHARSHATGNVRSSTEDRRVAGTTTSVLEAERSVARVNLGHESEVLREIVRLLNRVCNLGFPESSGYWRQRADDRLGIPRRR